MWGGGGSGLLGGALPKYREPAKCQQGVGEEVLSDVCLHMWVGVCMNHVFVGCVCKILHMPAPVYAWLCLYMCVCVYTVGLCALHSKHWRTAVNRRKGSRKNSEGNECWVFYRNLKGVLPDLRLSDRRSNRQKELIHRMPWEAGVRMENTEAQRGAGATLCFLRLTCLVTQANEQQLDSSQLTLTTRLRPRVMK